MPAVVPRAGATRLGRIKLTLVVALLSGASMVVSGAALPNNSGRESRVAARPSFSDSALPSSSLRIRDGDKWVTWWRSERAPVSWNGVGALARRVRWHDAGSGVAWGELSLAGDGEAWRTRLVVARVDPRRVRLELDTASADQRAAWSVERLEKKGDSSVFAVNAGQFLQSLPWGWVVLDGRQFLPPSSGPLSSAVIIDRTGGVHWSHGGSAAASRQTNVAWAFQSYPTLLRGGEVPAPLRASDRGIDARHRDARLAIGRLEGGRIVVAMTRFAALGGPLERLPFGLTTPEMAAVMGALGARDAVMLDGGISAQMLVRESDGTARTWPGLRAVPMALVARRR